MQLESCERMEAFEYAALCKASSEGLQARLEVFNKTYETVSDSCSGCRCTSSENVPRGAFNVKALAPNV